MLDSTIKNIVESYLYTEEQLVKAISSGKSFELVNDLRRRAMLDFILARNEIQRLTGWSEDQAIAHIFDAIREMKKD